MKNPYYFSRALLSDVIDGDTLDFRIDMGFHISARITVRLKGIDTPEIYRPSSDEEYQRGMEAKDFVASAIPEFPVPLLVWEKGKYGRWLGDVLLPKKGKPITNILDHDKKEFDSLVNRLIDEGYSKQPDEPNNK